MTLLLLASVSLLALVVTCRPIPPDADLCSFAPTSTLQTALQAPFQIDPGQDDSRLDAGRFQAQERKQQIERLSELDAENIASYEVLLEETADRQNAFDTNNDPDDSRVDHVHNEPIVSEPVVDNSQQVTTDETPSIPFVALAFSCIAAFLALACIASALYIVKSLRYQILASKKAWELLPRFWGCPRSSVPQKSTSAIAEGHLLNETCLQTEVREQGFLHTKEESTGVHELHMEGKLLWFDTVSDMESKWGDADGKYQDALDVTPLPLVHDLPLEEHVSRQSHSSNPPLPTLESSLDQPRGDRSAPLMRELCPSRPNWSVRAIDSPALGLSSRESSGVESTPLTLIHSRRHAYHSAVPEFDIALAMQLRPGLGIGADSAWMVRFLMAIFGWFAVALTGNTQ